MIFLGSDLNRLSGATHLLGVKCLALQVADFVSRSTFVSALLLSTWTYPQERRCLICPGSRPGGTPAREMPTSLEATEAPPSYQQAHLPLTSRHLRAMASGLPEMILGASQGFGGGHHLPPEGRGLPFGILGSLGQHANWLQIRIQR